MTWLRLALREIFNNKRFSFFFCLNFTLGFAGFLTLDAYKDSLRSELSQGSRVMLSADLNVETSNRDLTPTELAALTERTQNLVAAKDTRLFSMLAYKDKSRLARIIAISSAYPLLGEFEFADGRVIRSQSDKDIHREPAAWVYPDVLIQLGVKVGETIRIGEADFRITAVVTKESAGVASAFNFAPRVYISESFLEKTGLVQTRSRYKINRYYIQENPEALSDLVTDLKASIPAPDVEIVSHQDASENLARSLTYLNDYLGLIALVALFLAAIGGAYLYRSFITGKLRDIATLMSLGLKVSQIRFIYLLQLLCLGLVSSGGALLLSILGLRVIPAVTQDLLPLAVAPQLSLKVICIAVVVGVLGSILTCLPLLVYLGRVQPNQLFQESKQFKMSFNTQVILAALPALVVYWLMAVWESNSYKVGSIFVVTLLISCIIFAIVSRLLFSFMIKVLHYMPLYARLAIRNLERNRMSTGACFLTIALATMLMTIVPQMRDVVLEEVSNPVGLQRPELFLADVQDDQLQGLQDFLQSKDIQMQNVSPLIRARLMKIDGAEYGKFTEDSNLTREEQARQWARTRGQNLTYRQEISEAERMISGRAFSTASYDWDAGKPAEISIEMRYARRLNVKLGSILTFNVQGVEIDGVVVNIRRVKWTSFQPNFFIQFQAGVFDDAPKTYLASIAEISAAQKQQLQTDIVNAFPNISIIDITTTVERIMTILNKMEWIVKIMAYFAIFAGFVVLFSIANHQATNRRWDINLFKVLGAGFHEVRFMMVVEFATLGFCSAICGVASSTIIAKVFSVLIFDSPWLMPINVPVMTIAVVTGLSIFVALLATGKVLREKPLAILQSQS